LSRKTSLTVGVDSVEGATRLSKMAVSEGHVLNVRLEVNTGLRRTGISRGGAVELAFRIASLKNLNLSGFYIYRRGRQVAG
jgi:D-serine deaminase-like pyridoxal phosphate-dependent protein